MVKKWLIVSVVLAAALDAALMTQAVMTGDEFWQHVSYWRFVLNWGVLATSIWWSVILWRRKAR